MNEYKTSLKQHKKRLLIMITGLSIIFSVAITYFALGVPTVNFGSEALNNALPVVMMFYTTISSISMIGLINEISKINNELENPSETPENRLDYQPFTEMISGESKNQKMLYFSYIGVAASLYLLAFSTYREGLQHLGFIPSFIVPYSDFVSVICFVLATIIYILSNQYKEKITKIEQNNGGTE